LLTQLGWERFVLPDQPSPWGDECWRHPLGRKAIFLGDLVDRGPQVMDTVRIVRNMVSAGNALCVAGNHDVKLVKYLRGKQIEIKHGLEQSIAEVDWPLQRRCDEIRQQFGEFGPPFSNSFGRCRLMFF
jgi:protein phosphatase